MTAALTALGWLALFAVVALVMIVFVLWADTVITPVPPEVEAAWSL